MKDQKQSGSVIIWILVTIALMAALAYSMSQGGRSSTSMLSDEILESNARKIIAFGNDVKMAVKRIQLSHGVADADIGFNSTIYKQSNTAVWPDSPNCTNTACQVFASKGGPVKDMLFDDIVLPSEKPPSSGRPMGGHPRIYAPQFLGHGTAENDLVLMLVRMPKDLCDKVNEIAGNTVSYTWPDGGSWGSANYWTVETPAGEPLGDDITDIQGLEYGCANIFRGTEYSYFHVIKAR